MLPFWRDEATVTVTEKVTDLNNSSAPLEQWLDDESYLPVPLQ